MVGLKWVFRVEMGGWGKWGAEVKRLVAVKRVVEVKWMVRVK